LSNIDEIYFIVMSLTLQQIEWLLRGG